LLRVDDALLHGQVAVFWVNSTASTMILVANDRYANNDMLSMSLKLGKPSGVDLEIKTVANAIEILKNPENQDKKILVVVDKMEDALEICSHVSDIPEINLGGLRNADGKVRISIRVHLNENDIHICEQLHDQGFSISCMETPMSNQITYEEIIKIFNQKK